MPEATTSAGARRLADVVRQRWVQALVARAIWCPVTGDILDVRTCVVIVDEDGDPASVLSPAGWAVFADTPGHIEKLADRGCFASPSSVDRSRR